MTTLKSLTRNVRIENVGSPRLPYDKQDEWQKNANGYRLQLRYKGRKLTVGFWQGIGISGDPTAEGVLECLLSDASGIEQDFDSWARDLGYDPDSRKAERIYKACQKIRTDLERFLNGEFETFMYADR